MTLDIIMISQRYYFKSDTGKKKAQNFSVPVFLNLFSYPVHQSAGKIMSNFRIQEIQECDHIRIIFIKAPGIVDKIGIVSPDILI
jgi:hypothetical protein